MSDAPDAAGSDTTPATPPEPETVQSLALQGADDVSSREAWEQAAAAVLRKTRALSDDDTDAHVWDRLTRATLDGIAITPLGTPHDVAELDLEQRPRRVGGWDVRTQVADNATALADLDTGANSLWLKVDGQTDFAALLDGVFLDLAPVTLEGDVEAARAFLAYAADRELHPATNLGSGVSLAREAQQHAIRSVIVDADTVHDRGASDVQELAWALAQGVEALRIYAGAGFEAAEAARQIEFRLVATDEQFPTIAKFRAARRLWARVLELSGAPGVEMAIHAVTSRPMMSAYDPHTNMLRTTVAAFAAGVGGADAVTVLPFDEPLGAPTDFSRRIARNTSALLIDESHVAAVSDPAGGAYAVERLTADLAQAAWDLFVRLDDEGFSLLDDLIETVATERERQVALRTRPITGLSEFPQSAETRLEREPVDTTPVRRWGAAFEALRDDPRGSVWLAPLGTIAAHTARATFAGNLFAAGGVAITNPGPLLDVEALAAAYDGSPVVCLVGADAAYAEWGADAIAALRKSGAKHVILAGKPGDRTVAADLIDDSCAMGVDAIAFLTRTREASA